jgi:hypothetical protein
MIKKRVAIDILIIDDRDCQHCPIIIHQFHDFVKPGAQQPDLPEDSVYHTLHTSPFK